jgi:hypothetical protein
MLTLLTFPVTVQNNVDVAGLIIEVGEAENDTIGGGGIVTVTVVCLVTVPLGPDAVNVYVVVLEGDTVLEPDVETPPIP